MRSPLPTASAAASGTAEGVHPMGTNNSAVLQRTKSVSIEGLGKSLRGFPAHKANVARQSAFTVRGASAPRQIEGR